jgi:uncharacterized membrane protein
VLLGWLFGQLVTGTVTAATNSQVASRVHPQLIDLIAALATGAVGSFALVRSDVSDTLPGVAIAISLVPPLCVVGLTLESGAGDQALGALLLFATNFGAILLSGLVVMAVYRVFALTGREQVQVRRRLAVTLVVAFVVVLTVPLAVTTRGVVQDTLDRDGVQPVATRWAQAAGWQVTKVSSDEDGTRVIVTGALPGPDPAALRRQLVAAGQKGQHVTVELVPSQRVELDS